MCWIVARTCERCAATKSRVVDLICCDDGRCYKGYKQCDTC